MPRNEIFFIPLLFESVDVSSISPHNKSVISGTKLCPFSMAIRHKMPEKNTTCNLNVKRIFNYENL